MCCHGEVATRLAALQLISLFLLIVGGDPTLTPTSSKILRTVIQQSSITKYHSWSSH